MQAEIRKRLVRQVKSISLTTSRDDIIEYLYIRLDENERADAMDQGLEENIVIGENKLECRYGQCYSEMHDNPLIAIHLRFYRLS